MRWWCSTERGCRVLSLALVPRLGLGYHGWLRGWLLGVWGHWGGHGFGRYLCCGGVPIASTHLLSIFGDLQVKPRSVTRQGRALLEGERWQPCGLVWDMRLVHRKIKQLVI